MDLHHSLASPVWWSSVLLCTILLTTASSWLARRSAQLGNKPAPNNHTKARRLRLAAWAVALLVLANLAMLGSLAAANLRTPRLAGPVGLAFLLCCLISLVLAVLIHAAMGGPGDGDRS